MRILNVFYRRQSRQMRAEAPVGGWIFFSFEEPGIMRTKVVLILFGAFLLISPRSHATLVVLDFNALSTGVFTSHVEDGFSLTWIGYGDRQTVTNVGGANQNILRDSALNGTGAEIVIRSLNGSPFVWKSLDANNANNNTGQFRIDVRQGGLQQLKPTSSTFQTYNNTVSPGVALPWMRVNIVSASANYGVDNIVLDVVPEPGTLTFLGLGIVVFGVARKRRRLV